MKSCKQVPAIQELVMADNARTKAAVVSALKAQAKSLSDLAHRLEESSAIDLQEVSDLPQLLKQRRDQLNLGAPEVAELAGISPNTYRALEKPEANPRLETLERVGEVMNFKVWIELL